jgi:phosphoglycerate dehydrogenase-like enzyme
MIFALARRLRESMATPAGKKFSIRGDAQHGAGRECLGIIGVGRIGQRVAALGNALQMEVIAHDVHTRPELAEKHGSNSWRSRNYWSGLT